MRRAARVDANQERIVKLYRKAGFSVAITSALGQGFPDIVVGKHGHNVLIEIKDGKQPLSKQRLTEDEARFHSKWRGDIRIIKSEDDVLNHIEDLKDRSFKAAAKQFKELWNEEHEKRMTIIAQNGNDAAIYSDKRYLESKQDD